MTLYEYYEDTDVSSARMYCSGNNLLAQVFTVGVTGPDECFYAKSGAVRIYKHNVAPTSAYLYLSNIHDSDNYKQRYPSKYLTSGSIDVNNLVSNSGGTWHNIEFSNKSILLKRDCKYALVMESHNGTIAWVMASGIITDNGGFSKYSYDGGLSWTSSSGGVFFFKIYGVKGPNPTPGSDLRIYYSSLSNPFYIDGPCSRWDVNNYSITVETVLNKVDLNSLLDHITPGAVGQLIKIPGKVKYYDSTWKGKNTIKLSPIEVAESNLYKMRKDTILYVNNITTNPVKGASGYINVKIEGYISGSTI